MQILIDDGLAGLRTSGIGSHSQQLVAHLQGQQLLGRPSDVELAVHRQLVGLPRFVSKIAYHAGLHTVVPITFVSRKYDLVHFTNYYSPFWKPASSKYVVTIHDLAAWDIPELEVVPSWYWGYGRRAMLRSMRIADAIIVRTSSTGMAVQTRFGISRSKIQVCPDGIKPVFRGPVTPIERRDPLVLVVGILTRRKNPEAAWKAFKLLATVHPQLRLTFVGERWIGWDAVQADIDGSQLRDRVAILHGIDDVQLRGLYDRAMMLVAPSHYEGFGIPLVEAMARGLPIVASSIGVFREVAGEAAVYYGEPSDSLALANAIRALMEDSSALARLASAGLDLAPSFYWERVARRHIEIYEQAMA